ncbi:MAG: BatA and WFA domain-containing protein [Gemmatimonadaceae bacterium]|nr:BatA and WFA domain-containing protein [Gemmatimonadaceae bacterium]
MNFLSPAWLALGLAIAVPLLLHLRRRPVSRRVVFPAVRWLLRAQKEHSRELRLRNLLLMVLRAAIVLLITAAAAGPVVPGIPGGHAPTALAIVLDNSLSSSRAVSGTTTLEQLQAAALGVLSDASDLDRVWLVTVDGQVTGGTAAQVRDAVRRVAVWPGAGDLASSVGRAHALVTTAPGLSPRVFVATDGQSSSWRRVASASSADVTVFTPSAPPDAPSAGAAVVEAEPSPPRWSPRGRLRVRVAGPDSQPVLITLAGRTLARSRVGPDAPGLIAAAPVERGWLSGTVEIPPDAQRGDDRRWFAVWVGPAPQVRLDLSAGRFARAAFDALVADGRAQAGGSISVASAGRVAALPALLLAPSDAAGLPSANAALARLGVPWRFAPATTGAGTARGEGWVTGARVSKRFVLSRSGQGDAGPGDTLATVAGAPWIVSGPRYVLIGSPLDTAATDAMLRPGFVPWLGEVLAARLSGDGGPLLQAAPGGDVVWPDVLDALQTTEGTVQPLTGRRFAAPAEPGVYFAVRDGARRGALVVNSEPGESDVGRLGAQGVAARVRAATVTPVREAAAARRAAYGGGGAAAMLGPAILGALALLLVEGVAARHGKEA